MVLIAGSAHPELAKEISSIIGVPLADADIKRFSDGEVSVQINHNLRGKDVFVIQSCVAPVNDSIMELLLTVSCVRRSSARRVIAVIPYFGYKHHRRGAPISTKHNSRFLFSSSMAFAKMLQEMGVDRVIAVDLQRPGQGHEACFFDNNVPLETIMSADVMVDYLRQSAVLNDPIVVIAPNSECVKKARNFQLRLQEGSSEEVKLLAFFPIESGEGSQDPSKMELLGKAEVRYLYVVGSSKI
jgi:ribose-phosphate pyrophosphokinase